MLFSLLSMLRLPRFPVLRNYSHQNRNLDLYAKTEERIARLFPDDISLREFSAIERARSLGLFPMNGGWMAGGYVAKLAMKRIRSKPDDDIKATQRETRSGPAYELAQELGRVEASLPAATLLRLRTDLVTRGLIK